MQKKKAISLIVLVITIIVMIILVGVIVLSLNSSQIFNQANSAVKNANINEIQHLASLKWADAYVKGARKKEDLKQAVIDGLAQNGITEQDYAGYKLIVTTSGVDILDESAVWKQEGTKVTLGDKELNIGDLINYTATGTDYEGEWRVLGASDDGNLLIMSTENVDSCMIGGKADYITGIDKLDDICKQYGNGNKALYARSIRVEDINKVTGYNPNDFGKDTTSEYGNKITYNWSSGNKIYVSCSKKSTLTSNVVSNHIASDGKLYFTWFDEKNNIVKTNTTETDVTLTNTYYAYDLDEYGITIDSNIYKMLSSAGKYWTASRYISQYIHVEYDMDLQTGAFTRLAFLRHASFGYFISGGHNVEIRGRELFISNNGSESKPTLGVRAVVELAPNINLTGSSEQGWSYGI